MIVLRTPKAGPGLGGSTAMPWRIPGARTRFRWPTLPGGRRNAGAGSLAARLPARDPVRPGGRLAAGLRTLAPTGARRVSANPHADGGHCGVRSLPGPDAYSLPVAAPGAADASPTQALAPICGVMRANPDRFRLFGPDETASNRLEAVYEASGKAWMVQRLEGDADGGHLAPDGRVMEILSEQTLQGWLEGYTLTGRHGLFATYEAFAHVIDSMFNQHAKWLDKARRLAPWRARFRR